MHRQDNHTVAQVAKHIRTRTGGWPHLPPRSLAADRGGQDMTVVRVGKVQGCDERLVAGHQESRTAVFINWRKRSVFSTVMSGMFFRKLSVTSSKIFSVHFACTKCGSWAIRINKSRRVLG